jgi:cytochrome P450 family 4
MKGAKWKSRRRLLTPAFHFNIMEDFFETFNEHGSIFCRKLDDICRHDKTEIDIQKLTSLCTLDIICGDIWRKIFLLFFLTFFNVIETAMGCKVNAQTQESEYVKAVTE